MKKKNLILGISFFIFLIIFVITGSWLNQKDKNIILDSVVDAAITSQGEYWLVDMGGKRVIYTDSSLKVKKIYKPDNTVKQLVVNDDGEVYLHTVSIKDQNNSLAGESIYRLSPQKNRMEAVYEKIYDERKLRGEIFHISGMTDDVILGMRSETGFGFYQLQQEGTLKELFFKKLEEADVWISSGLIMPEEKKVYYCLQNGIIYEYDIKTNDERKVYQGSAHLMREGVPRELTYDNENNLYFTDLGLRDIGCIKDGKLSYLIGNHDLEQEVFLGQESYIGVTAEQGLVACSSYALYCPEGEEFIPYYELELGQQQIIYSWLSKISLVIMAVIFLHYCVKLLKHIMKGNEATSKLMLAMCVVISIITTLFLVMVIPDYKEQMMKELEYRTQNVAYLTAANIPSQSLLNLDSVEDFRNEDYNEVKKVVDKIFFDVQGVQDFYCTIYTVRDDVITINYSSEESNGSVYPYDWTYEGSDEQEIMETGVGRVYTAYLNSDGNYTFSLYPIIKENMGSIGLVEVGVNTQPYEEHINELIFDLLITMVVAAVVIIFLILEILVFWEGRKKWVSEPCKYLPNELLRTLVFLIFLATNIATSFLPIYALKLTENMEGAIAGEIWASLVISAEVFAGAILSLKGNIILNKWGERKSAILCSFIMIGGMFLRMLPDITFLIIGQLLIGAGWGVILLIVNTRISINEEETDEGFAGYSAAAFNGINCGVVLGGFAMKFMSYQTIILVAATLSLLVLLHCWKFIRNQKYEEVHIEEKEVSMFVFLSKRRVWGFLLLLVLPVIACGYYLNYLYPILAANTGMEESYIGYSYLLNGMIVLTMGNFLSKELSKWLGRKLALVLSVILYAITFILISFSQGIPVLLLSLLLLGMADSFGLPLQSSYFMDLEETKKFGYDRASGIYSLTENIAQSAGPMMFGYILIFGISAGLKLLAVGIVILGCLFLVTSIIKDKYSKR